MYDEIWDEESEDTDSAKDELLQWCETHNLLGMLCKEYNINI